jgi:hypothetical protein
VNITPIIRELLLRNQKAVIPGLGTLIISQRAAQLNKITKVLSPPSRQIRFETNRQIDDASLSAYIVQKLKQKPDLNKEVISQFKKSVEDQLKSKGLILLEGLGTLTWEKSGEFTFKPEEELLKQINPFELPKLNVQAAQQDDKPTPTTVAAHATPVRHHTRERRWWIPAALIVLLLGLAGGAYYAGLLDHLFAGRKTEVLLHDSKKDNDRLVFGSRGNTDSLQSVSDSLKALVSREIDERTAREKALLYEENKPKTAVQKEVKVQEPVQLVMTDKDKPYHVIAGSFTIIENAEKHVIRLQQKGYTPVLLPRRGKYFMVSLGSYSAEEEATAAKRKFKVQLDQELWVMRR